MTPEAKIALAIKVLEQSHWNLGEITDGNDDLDLKKWNDLMYDALTALRSAEPQASERPERVKCQSCGGDCVAYSRVNAMCLEINQENARHKDVERRYFAHLTQKENEVEALKEKLADALQNAEDGDLVIASLNKIFDSQADC